MARGISARKACRLVGISRSSFAYRGAQDRNAALRDRLHQLAEEHPKMGYRMAWAHLKDEFSPLNLKRVRRLWNEEGLNLKRKESNRIRVAARPIESAASPNEGWSMDFCHDSLASGLKVKCLVIVDEATRECVALEAHRRIPSSLVVATLERAFSERGVPSYIRCDNGPEFRSWSVRLFLKRHGVKLVWIQPGSPWQNGFAERFIGTLRSECLSAERLVTLAEAQVHLGAWRRFYNESRPHSSLGYQSPSSFSLGLSRSVPECA
ncbi:MAG: IS3 family transposase [Bryobacteraceae bacterium]|nr:IS3 family transposase [Bryobacteraceae bacterium]